MVAERLIGNATIDTPDNVAGTARMLGWNWETSAANKVVKNIYVRMPSGGSFAAGTMAQLWKRASPISSSTRLQNIDISAVTGTGGTWVVVPGVTQSAIVQGDPYFVTLYQPSTDGGAYWFKSGFGDPTSGSLSGNCIFKNGGTVDQAPDDETFTNGGFGIDVEIDDAGVIHALSLNLEADSAFPLTFERSLSFNQILETDSAFPLTFERTLVLSLNNEVNTVLPMTFIGGSTPMPDTRGWIPQVGGHCVYLQKKTFGGNSEYVKRRPAIITAVNGDGTVNVRVGHHGETYTNVPAWSVSNLFSSFLSR